MLISIRGPVEAIVVAKGAADIADVKYAASTHGDPYCCHLFLRHDFADLR